ncbi:MAG TPA: hypothetical protein VIG66_03510 [Noviherbaspirillum sp.]
MENLIGIFLALIGAAPLFVGLGALALHILRSVRGQAETSVGPHGILVTLQ